MDLRQGYQEACTEFGRLKELLAEASKQDMEPEARNLLGFLSDALDKSFAEVQASFPAAVNDIDRMVEDTKVSLANSEAELAGIEQSLAEALAAAAVAAPLLAMAPAAAIDPRYGRVLTTELLERVGKKSAAAPAPAGDVAEMQSADFHDRSVEQPGPAGVKGPAATEPPKSGSDKRPSKDISDLSSGAWSKE